jgi:dolichol-phosphate mannosyltransferase
MVQLPELSVVVPCYNEEDCLDELHRRLSEVCAATVERWEIVLVDDGSRDRTWSILERLARDDPHLVAVKLSRNHGHQLALTAGLSVARGDRVLIIDADLQDPPEALMEMMRIMDGGADVVYGQREHREGESWFKLRTASAFYRLINALSDQPIPVDTGDFRLISRRALDVLQAMPERHRFIRGMVSWIGFRQEPYRYRRDPRFAGQTKYPLRKMVRLALDAITSFSTRPLRVAGVLSMLTMLLGFAILVYVLVSLALGSTVSGWASVLGALAIFSSLQLFVLGLMGTYVGRMFEQIKGRPLFIIQDIRRGAPGDR